MSLPRLLQEMRSTFILHAVAAHFPNGLIPVAVTFMLLALVTADPYSEHTVLHLLLVTFCMIPVSFISGIRDWRRNFHGAKAPIFRKKLTLAAVLFLLCGASIVLRLRHPDILSDHGVATLLYGGSLLLMLLVVTLLGHFGAKLAAQVRKQP